MPSVGGRRKLIVGGLFVVAGTASGALVGFVASLPLLPFPEPEVAVVAVFVATAVGLDLVAMTGVGPSPPTSGKQVPQEWSRFFGAEAVAVLYGSRLGVGPLTILSTWTWWAATLASGLIGPGAATLVGGTFGLVRLVVTVLASTLADRSNDSTEHTAWFGRLRQVKQPNWLALNGAGLFLVAAAVLTGCGATENRAAPPVEANRTSSIVETVAVATGPNRLEQTLPTIPVRLEDVVRTATTLSESASDVLDQPAESIDPGPLAVGPADESPEALATALPTALVGFSPIDDPNADRFLDLAAAAAIQPDQTEEIALLETRGFAGGWTRAFRNGTNDVAVASVYHFEDATEAEFYLEDGLITIGGYGGKFFDIPALPGVRGFVQYFTEPSEDGGPDEELISLGAAFQLGPRWHLLYLVGSAETVTPEVLLPAVTALSESAQQA